MASIVRTQNTMYFLVLPLLLHCSVGFPVFTFNGTSTSQETLSYAFLAKEVSLPDIFTLCTSVKQARFDGHRFYSIIGNDSRDWMLMRFKTFSNETKLTLNLGEDHRYHHPPWSPLWHRGRQHPPDSLRCSAHLARLGCTCPPRPLVGALLQAACQI